MNDFETFMKEYGPPKDIEKASAEILNAYRNRVPAQLLDFWGRFGFASYGGGLLWVTNPTQLEDVLSEWVPRKSGRAVPVVRTAFGDVVYWLNDKFTLLDVHFNDRFEPGDDAVVIFDVFLIGEDARLGILHQPLFKRALQNLGPLQRDEMYGYKLALAMGGDRDVKNLMKMKMREQLSILAQIHQQ